MSADVVVVASDALGADGRAQVHHLVRLLTSEGHHPELVVLGQPAPDAWADLRPRFDRAGPVRRRLGHLPMLLRPGVARPRGGSGKLRRRLRQLDDRPWILCDPAAAADLAALAPRPPTLVVHLADPGAVATWPTLSDPWGLGPDLWLAVSERQLGTGTVEPAEVVGALVPDDVRSPRPSPDPADPIDPADRPVVLSTPPRRWTSVDHLVEIAAQLHGRLPEHPLLVLTEPGEDEWLVHHDLAHLGLAATVRVQARTSGEAVVLPRLVIRTGYVPSDADLVLRSAAAGVPILGFDVGDLVDPAEPAVAPFAVEALVERAVELLAAGGPDEGPGPSTRPPAGQRPPAERAVRLLELLGPTGPERVTPATS